MKKFLLSASLVVATLTTSGIAQNAGPGAWKLPGTEFLGYFAVRSEQPDGTVRGNNPDTVYSGATGVIVYEFQVGSTNAANANLKPSADICKKIEAELIKNERSVLRYFDKLPAGAMKPQPFSSVVHTVMMTPHSNWTTEVVGGNIASHTRCYARFDTYYKKLTDVIVVGTYRK